MQARIETAEQLIREVLSFSTQLRKRTGALPAAALRVLECLLGHGPLTVPQVARNRQTSRQNIQVIVNGLARDGWVVVAPNPAHKRSPLISLTDKGQVLLTNSQGGNDKELPLVGLNEQDTQLALDVLRRLGANLRTSQTEEAFVSRAQPPATASNIPASENVTDREKSEPANELPVTLL